MERIKVPKKKEYMLMSIVLIFFRAYNDELDSFEKK
jgi:hypothetical protein